MSRGAPGRGSAKWIEEVHLHAVVVAGVLSAYLDPERSIGQEPTITIRREMLRHVTALLKATEELYTRTKRMVELLEHADDPEDGTVVNFEVEMRRIARKAGQKHVG